MQIPLCPVNASASRFYYCSVTLIGEGVEYVPVIPISTHTGLASEGMEAQSQVPKHCVLLRKSLHEILLVAKQRKE